MLNKEKLRLTIGGIISSALLGLNASPALAQGMGLGPDAGFYVGAGAGFTSIDLCGDPALAGATSCDDDDVGFKVFGGFKFNQYFGAEIGYADLGEVSVSGPGGTATAEVDGFQFAAVGSYPIEQFSLLGKVGFFAWDGEISTPIGSFDDDGTDFMFGLGGAFHFTPQFSVRGEWERFDVDGDDVDMFSASIIYNF
ncbi:MAG: outer membrane beta-barrel protein [Gammaproteobacteria bacterium]|nr:outer membrane beta-barrel protein [Gammaproteobacteria bacterium]MDH3412114.1 outer membrane beta-barrel protein [Gammaproteobacteria bacterium]